MENNKSHDRPSEERDEQEYMVKFESMSNAKGKPNSQLYIVHKELDRQKQAYVRHQEIDRRQSMMTLNKERSTFEARQQRIRRDQAKWKKEREKLHAYLEQSRVEHEDKENAQKIRERQVMKGLEEERPDMDNIMKTISKYNLPDHVKKHIYYQMIRLYGQS